MQPKNGDTRSKWVDGPLAFVLIMALMAVLILLIKPFESLGNLGLAAYMLLSLALSILALRWSLDERQAEIRRAWFGLAGGMLAWTMVEMAQLLGFALIEEVKGGMIYLLAVLATAVLWKNLPLGAKFWLVLLFMNWSGHMLIFTQRFLAQTAPIFTITEKVCAGLAGIAIPALLYWLFARSKTRIQRLWAAAWIWSMVSVLYYVLRG